MPNAIAKNTNTNKVYIDTVQIPRIKRNEEDYFYNAEITVKGIMYLVFYDEFFRIKSLSWLNGEYYDPLIKISKWLHSELINIISSMPLEKRYK